MSGLTGRTARCAYGCKEVPSTPDLAFFEYCGPGSREATQICRHCRYADVAHTPEVMARNPALKCIGFEANPQGGDHDRYYCGCRGWD